MMNFVKKSSTIFKEDDLLWCNVHLFIIQPSFFLLCPFAINIWHFFVDNSTQLTSFTCLFQVFLVKQTCRFSLDANSWNILILAVLWAIWITCNNVSFRSSRPNTQALEISVFQTIIALSSFWTEHLPPTGGVPSAISNNIREFQNY